MLPTSLADAHYDDGTSSVKISVVRDPNTNALLANPRSVAEDSAGNFLDDLLKSLQVTLPNEQYLKVRATFQSYSAVSFLFYPVRLDLGWNENRGTVRLLISSLPDDAELRQRAEILLQRKDLTESPTPS